MSDTRIPDATNLKIIELLRADPQVTNKAIALRIDVSETTVAHRIRAMSEDRVMRVVAQRDIFSDRYSLLCFVYIDTSGRSIQKIAQDIAKFEEVTSVSHGIGSPELFVNVRAADRKHLDFLIGEQIGGVKGVARLRSEVCLRIIKYIPGFGDLSEELPETTFSEGEANKDDQIISLLLSDGRMSNREIARQLDISEGNVRQRLRRMDDANVMRLGVVCDSVRLGISSIAITRIAALPSKMSKVLDSLSAMESVAFLASTTGDFNVTALVHMRDTLELAEFCNNQIRSIGGVIDMRAHPLVQSEKHRYDLVRIR